MDYKFLCIVVLSALVLLFVLLTIIFAVKNKKSKQQNIDLVNHNLEQIEELYKYKEVELERRYEEKRTQLVNQYDELKEQKETEFNQAREKLGYLKESINAQCEDYKAAEMAKVDSEIMVRRISENRKIEDQFVEKRKKEQDNFDAFCNDLSEQKTQLQGEFKEIMQILNDFRARREVVNQQVLREKEIQENTDFYRICINDKDKNDLELIKEIEGRFNNKEVLYKAAYECYVKRPLQEMEKRVLADKKPSGIYIITYIPTGEIYIGRSTDIATRWVNHVKTACGLQGAAHSTLHTKMAEKGLWNFTFQILEEVEKDKLGEREKYWIDVYGAQGQLNQKAGG